MSLRDDIEFVALIVSAITGVLLTAQAYSTTLRFPSWIPPLTSTLGLSLGAIISAYIFWYVLKFIGGSELATGAAVASLNTIEGCVETGGVAWSGTAYLQDGQVENIDVPFKPICPECQTGLVERTKEATAAEQRLNPAYTPDAQPIPIYLCPNDSCQYSVERDPDKYDDAQLLFERHVKRITETRDEDYSLRNLVSNIENAATPKSVWEEYAEVVDDEQVSTNCFH